MSELNKWFRIQVITTGGTIDKTYDELEGTLALNRETILKRELNEKLRLPYTEVIVSSIMAKDSLEMDANDRQTILNKIIELQSDTDNPIVILHGTDTMQNTAELVQNQIPSPSTPIIFTGAMKPLGFVNSDALQNVSEALMAAQFVQPGIYISFHNRLFEVPGVRKNKVLGTFEAF